MAVSQDTDAAPKLSIVVLSRLRQSIVTGEIAPGTRLVERDIAAQLGVSRVPVREALHRLRTDGLVVMSPRRGATVRQFSRTDVEQLFDIREALEVMAARQAATAATDAELARLIRVADAGVKAVAEGDLPATHASQEAVHDALISMAHNDMLSEILRPVQVRLEWVLFHGADPHVICQEHRRLADAINTRNPDTAAHEALQHVQVNRARSIAAIFDTTGVAAG